MTNKLRNQILKIVHELCLEEDGKVLNDNYGIIEECIDKLIEDEYNLGYRIGYQEGEDYGYEKDSEKNWIR